MRAAGLAVVIALVAIAAAQTPAPDPCAQYPTCQICVAQPLCGWCSVPVTYPGPHGTNITGAQCAGFNPSGPDPFDCPAIYSTETCTAGYVCNEESFTCQLGAPGTGLPLDQCQQNCTNNGQVYLCNLTTKKCNQVPQGTPGSASLEVCEASCAHPTAHPSSPNPAPQPKLYSCNYTTGTCDPAPAGKGSSLEVCEQTCSKNNGTQYMCNQFTHQCVALPPSVKGESLQQCQQQCNPQPTPNPPPNFPTGLWRGIQIDNAYQIGEFDLFVNSTTVLFVSMVRGLKAITVTGKPFHLPNEQGQLLLYIQITSGSNAGQFIKTLADVSGAPGPETVYMTMAMSTPGGAAPSTIQDSFNQPGISLFAFAKCNDANCVFSLPDGAVRSLRSQLSVVDHCSQYYQNCSYCLSHSYCGWCSTDVTYADGTKGTQCAGFNSPTQNSSAAFQCAGHYSTLNCDAGYTCDQTTFQCVPAPPGNGVTKAQCETLCHPTPPPTPPQQQYVCNVSLKQCFKCNATHCPGSLPQGPCEAACVHPKHGPHSNLIGVWRGIRIQNGYETGEVEMAYTKTNMSFYVAGAYQFTANITSLGADLMIFDVLDGQYKGATFGAIYQISNQYQGIYDQITFARGLFGRSAPQSYDEAMFSTGMTEYTLVQCKSGQCQFKQP